MNPRELLGKTFACACGRNHTVPTREIVYAKDALEQIPGKLERLVEGRRIALVADERTWDVVGQTAEQVLNRAGWSVHDIIIPDTNGSSPVCDDITHDRLNERLVRADITLAVGSGVISDLTKWSAFEQDIPYAALATAATMNGFTAANVAPIIRGIKTIIPARPPVAVFAVPSIIVSAPFVLTAAGLGDTIAKPVSTADWLLNHTLCDEYFCRYCSEIINDLEPSYLDRPAQIKMRDPVAIEALFSALLNSGIAMTIVGTSAPASGGEHLLSHTLDMMSGIDGVAHDLHGRQVGLGAIFSSALYERLFEIDTPTIYAMPPGVEGSFWGAQVENVREQYWQKLPALRVIRDKLKDRNTWRRFRDLARQQVRPPQVIKNCLSSAGAAHTFADIGCSRERLLDAIVHMHEIRKRPTVVDLAWMLGILPEAADDIVDTWLTA